MKLNNHKCKNPTWLVVPVTAALMAAGATFNAYGATAAGTEIKNLATVSYEDAAGNSYTAQSNEAIVTVAQVYSATINSTDTSVAASPGQPVDISYTLENTGNGSDTYQLTAVDGHTTADSIDADNITIYEDLNNNGQADPGEPVITSLTLDSGEITSIVVRVEVPTNSVAGDNLGLTLTALAEEDTGAPVAGSVIDLTSGKGPDTLDSTVETLVDVTGDAVIVATKSSVHDSAANTITYTMTVKNNGNADAQNVLLRDAIPENTTYVPGSASTSGILASNAGDSEPATSILDETVDGVDYNGDGDTLDAGLSGISAGDGVLPANATVTVTYTVSYDPTVVPGGTVISNVAYVVADADGDGTAEPAVSTNQTNDTVLDTLVVAIEDTGEGAADIINDGQDDDGANEVQLVSQASAGDTVVFRNVITNNGNTSDVLELAVNSGNFPAGTVFTFWNADGTVQLNDSNGEYGVDAGIVAAYGSETITVLAQLPSGVSGAGPFDATVTVTSATDPTVSDTVTERLAVINDSAIDIHNAAGGALATDEDPIGAPEYAAVNTTATDVNTSVTIPLFIDNPGNEGNSYQLNAGSVYDAAAGTVSGLPDGWTVDFYLSDGAGAPTGNPITTTPVIPGQTTDFEIFAVITVPSDQTQAVDNFSNDNDADGALEDLDGNGDGDADYPLFFQVVSANTGASDVTLEAIDVNAVVAATLSPNGSDQIEAGGTEEYLNTLANNGNATETYEVVSSNSAPGWSSTLSVDTDGDGVADTELANLVAGPIQILQSDGSVATIEVAAGANGPTFQLDAGESLPITSTVFAPANAPDSQTDALTITATNVNSGDVITAINQTQAVSGQVSLVKTVSIDADCDNVSDDGIFTAIPTTEVRPDECLVWQIVAQNQGSSNAFNVQVRDAAPAFTNFVPGSLAYCINQNCVPATVSDAAGDDAGEESAGEVVFYVGAGSTPGAGLGGELVSGNYATVQFSVRVE